jgi:hypothetical protein
MSDEEKFNKLSRALGRFNVDLDQVRFIERDALSTAHLGVVVHMTDKTPVVVAPELGGATGYRERCEIRNNSIDIGGVARTGNNGRLLWKMSNFICETDGSFSDYIDPVSFVATARSKTPVLVTTVVRRVDSDVEIDVYSWMLSGEPAPSIRFNWRCWVEGGVDV